MKNVKRWIESGPERKKGGGRKANDKEMEDKLYQWCTQMTSMKKPFSQRTLKKKAIEFCKDPNFIASQTWVTKFLSRNKNIKCTKTTRLVLSKKVRKQSLDEESTQF